MVDAVNGAAGEDGGLNGQTVEEIAIGAYFESKIMQEIAKKQKDESEGREHQPAPGAILPF